MEVYSVTKRSGSHTTEIVLMDSPDNTSAYPPKISAQWTGSESAAYTAKANSLLRVLIPDGVVFNPGQRVFVDINAAETSPS